MLYQLRLGTRSDRRSRMASACRSLRESGLSDYETRDLNDEINKLMREKRHWESQIVALGGANYRRNVTMLDDDGKEVPGTKGYKHFGRAKDLPGVRELFRSRKTSEDEDNAALVCYKKILGQGPAYYGDVDDMDGPLLEFEHHAEEGDWEDVCSNLREALGLPAKSILFAIPRQPPYVASISPDAAHTGTKRKITDSDADMLSSLGVKRAKADSPSEADQTLVHARAAVSHIPLLTVENLLPPKLPTHTEMEAVLLALRKKALVEEYFGDGE
ncbi:Isy1-like splicing factor [Mycena alexandri]|uniref:Isy1-like splicing factor n=1 Tax=Mycena alexandri TaxID=1745969 RepID=A0AAD6X117_9AGAR|nr:Isy1-like splicing factor [Mycena alexandri]